MKQLLSICILSFGLVLAMGGTAMAQKGKTKPEPDVAAKPDAKAELLARYQSIYQSALSYNDFAVATEAMYHMISLQPEKAELRDTLAALYFQRAAWPQVILISTEILEKKADNIAALELRAVANQSIGRMKEALEDYEDLYKLNANPYHLYEVAALQLNMKRFLECEGSVRQLLSDPGIKDKTLAISLQDGRSQDVPLAAAASNLYGVLEQEQGRRENAIGHFESALAIYPEFLLAKNNLTAAKKP